MHPPQRPEQTPVHATWSVRVEATSADAVHHVAELVGFPADALVVLDVGASFPWSPEIDARLLPVLVDHLRAHSLRVELQGAPASIRRWWHSLRDEIQPTETTVFEIRRQRRHLRLVAQATGTTSPRADQ